MVSKNLAMAALDTKLKEIRRLVRGATFSVGMIDDDQTDCASPKNVEEEFLKVQTELRSLKAEISHQSKRNFKLEKDLRFLDSKIALLINHKISIEELEKRVFDEDIPTLPGSLKDLTHPELYGRLFFILQTSPEYTAKLTRLVTLKEIDGLLQIVMFALYGNQYEDREEHLLLSMFEHALTYEVQEATEINSLMRANTAITRMMTNYCRRGPGQEYIKSSLGDTIQKLIAFDKSLEIDPMKIYHGMIESGEVQKPEEPNRLLQAAEANPAVQKQIQEHIPILQDFVLTILDRLKATIDEVPFGIRWLCKATRALVQEKFPEATAERVNSFIGGFFFLRYINPIIATPHAYRLVHNPPTQIARRNLTLVAKLIQKLANVTSVRESYMLPLEPFVRSHHDAQMAFLSDLCEVHDFHEALQLEEYIALCRKDMYIDISVSEVAQLHSLLIKYQKDMVSSPDDPLCEVLRELSNPTEEMGLNLHTIVKLELIQHSRENLDMPAFAPRGVSLDVSDEIATTRRQCKHLLQLLFSMAPHCLQEPDLQGALKVAVNSQFQDVVSHAELTNEHVRTLRELGGLGHQGRDLFEEIKTSFPTERSLLQKARLELKSLRSVHETMAEHTEYLQEQLDAYKEYLSAVRAKVGMSGNSHVFRKPRGTYRFTHAQLEKEGVILETPGIPVQRRGSVYYILSCLEPGIYSLAMHHKGHSKAIYDKRIHLEDLLELQHLRDPVIDLEGFVVLNVRRTLLLLNRHFIRRDSASHHQISRHFSAPALAFTGRSTTSNS